MTDISSTSPEPSDDSVLTPDEEGELAAHEAVIQRGLKTFEEVRNALLAIRDKRLYRKTHKTWEAYLRDRWVMSKAQGNRLISAAEVVELIRKSAPNGAVPINEAQARELAKIPSFAMRTLDNVRQRIEAAGGYGEITAVDIARMREEEMEAWEQDQRVRHTKAASRELMKLLEELDRGDWALEDVAFGDDPSNALRLIDTLVYRLGKFREWVAESLGAPTAEADSASGPPRKA